MALAISPATRAGASPDIIPQLCRTSARCFSKPTRNAGAVAARARVRAVVKDCEARVWDRDQSLRLGVQFSAPVKRESSSSTKQREEEEEEEEKQKYYVNTGYAIRTLREEFPGLFDRELSLDIYRDDIVFKDPLNTFSGIENYKTLLGALRFHGRIFFKALWVDIISIWQPVESVIMIRWTVRGVARVLWGSHGRFDGVSEYKLDKNGKIYEHQVHNIALNSPPKFQVLSVQELIQSISCPSTPEPTLFEISSSSYPIELGADLCRGNQQCVKQDPFSEMYPRLVDS